MRIAQPSFLIRAAVSAVLVCFMLGCLPHPQSADAAEEEPIKWDLSPEAEHIYYYLLLSEAMHTGDDRLAGEALRGLLKYDPSLPVFRDGATILMATGDFPGAADVCRRGLAQYPDDEPLTVLLSGALSEQDRDGEAVALMEKYLDKKPDSSEARQELVRLYLRIGATDKALDLLGNGRNDENSAPAMLFRARVLAGAGKTAEATAALKALVRKYPDFAQGWVETALLAERGNRRNDAMNAYRKALDLLPESLDLWYRLISLQLKDGKPLAAIQTLDKAPDQGSFRLQVALLFADEGHNKEALDLLQSAVKSGADPDEASYYRSIIELRMSGDVEGALMLLQSIPTSSPLYDRAKLRALNILLDAGRFEEAEKAAAQARTVRPDLKELWGVQAFALLKQNKADEAVDLMKQALAKFPDDEDLLFSLGHIQEEAGQRDAALATMEQIIKKNPRHYKALNYVGYTLADRNTDLARALELINRALAQAPDEDYIVDSLAWVQYRMGHFADAWQSIQRCIALGGDDPTIWEHYGDIAHALKKKNEALKGWNEALRRNPSNPEVLREKIARLLK